MKNEFKIELNENELKYKESILYLADTDYIANKIIEYQFLEKELDNDYSEALQKREEAREVIREYEAGK